MSAKTISSVESSRFIACNLVPASATLPSPMVALETVQLNTGGGRQQLLVAPRVFEPFLYLTDAKAAMHHGNLPFNLDLIDP